MTAWPYVICNFSRWLSEAVAAASRGFAPPLALSESSIALPRCEIASANAERRKAWSPALPHHSIASSVWPPCVMMRERLGLRRGRGQQNLGRAPVQRLAAALQEAVVGGVLDQRVLEAIVRV